MNGCYHSKWVNGKVKCEYYDEAHCMCRDEKDTVSRYDGQPMCRFHPNAIDRTEYIRIKENK